MTDKPPDDLEEHLTSWGASEPPRVDGAFANRLESSLRREILDGVVPSRPGIGSLLLRPSVVVLGIAVLLFGFAMVSRSGDNEAQVADGAPSGRELPTTTNEAAPDTTRPAIPGPTVTTDATDPEPSSPTTEQIVDPPETTVPPTAPVSSAQPTDQTTVPVVDTTVPVTDSTTTPPTTEALKPEVVASLGTPSDGRITVTWRVGGDTSDVAGWVVVRTIGDSRQTAATVRETSARRVVVDVVNRDAIFRVEGRSQGGELVVQSEAISISRDG